MTMPKIALVGLGKMGRAVRQAMLDRGVAPVASIDPTIDGCSGGISRETLNEAEVCIEFTQPDAVRENVRRIAAFGCNVVIGTTGWEKHRKEMEQIVSDAGIGLLWASNLSLGVHIFSRLATEAAKLLNAYSQYDVALQEVHHRGKKDAPSGTALVVAERMLKSLTRKTTLVPHAPDGLPAPEALYISSMRVGGVIGTHTILIDGTADGIELTHRARNRDGFAEGALLAASWIVGKTGFYSIEDMFDDIESV